MNKEQLEKIISKINWEGGIYPFLFDYGGQSLLKDTSLFSLADELIQAYENFSSELESLCYELEVDIEYGS